MDRRTFLKRTGQTIAGIAVAPLAVAAASPAKIPVAQEPDMYFGTRIYSAGIDLNSEWAKQWRNVKYYGVIECPIDGPIFGIPVEYQDRSAGRIV